MNFIRNAGFRDHFPIWKVARATSAAPAYFREMDIENRPFIDGAIGFNNPTEELHDEVKYLYGGKANSLIVSIGTGKNPRPTFVKGTFGLLRKGVSMLTDCEKIHANMVKKDGLRYYRFNVEDDVGKIKIGAYKELPTIKEKTEKYLRDPDVENRLRKVAEILVTNRHDRIAQNKDRWEAFCCDIRYQCPGLGGDYERCQYGYHERTRHRFVEHLQRDHGITDEAKLEEKIEESKKIHFDLEASRRAAQPQKKPLVAPD